MILWVYGSEDHPVFNCWNGKYYGRITEIIIDDTFSQVLGFACRTRIFRPRWAFDISAVRLANDDLILVERKGMRWLPLNKALHKAWKEARTRPRIKVVKNGAPVGEVTDFAFDSETGRVQGVTVSRGLLGKLSYIPKTDIETTGSDWIGVRGEIQESGEPKPEGGLLNGLLITAAKSLGRGIARAKESMEERNAASLEGQTAPAEIRDDKGRIIISEGNVMTSEAVEKLKQADKLTEATLLMMGKKFGSALAKANRKLRNSTKP